MLLFKSLHRFPGIALPFTPQLHVRNLQHVGQLQRLDSHTGHLQPMRMARSPLHQKLMGRDSRRNQVQLIKLQLLHCLLCRRHMSQMDGIKGPAIDADIHRCTFLVLL